MSTNPAPTIPAKKDRFDKAIAKLASARPTKAGDHVALQGGLAATIQEGQRDGSTKIAEAIGQLSTRLGQKTSGVAAALAIAAFGEKGNLIGKIGAVIEQIGPKSMADVAALKDVDDFHKSFSRLLAAAKLLTPNRENTREFVGLAKAAEQYLK